jgi:hypothetical protein
MQLGSIARRNASNVLAASSNDLPQFYSSGVHR